MKLPMRYCRWILLGTLLVAIPTTVTGLHSSTTMQKKARKEKGRKEQDPELAIGDLVRGMQLDLESSSGQGFLARIDAAKFVGYADFGDMIQRLTSEDDLRVYFREVGSSIQEDRAQWIADSQMELTRKDSAGQSGRRSQKLTIDFERTAAGWKIVNIAPRDFFQPL